MLAERFIDIIGADFFTGVPDSALKGLCDCLYERYGTEGGKHIIAANEGNCAALAAGYHLATGRVPVVYMQNSGEGNIINPSASLLNKEVYGIPVLFVIGWRGEPGVRDEPQHIFQGRVTLELLEVMNIPYAVITADTSEEELHGIMESFRQVFAEGKQAALAVRSGALEYSGKVSYRNNNTIRREEAIKHITAVSGDDPLIVTTGKAGRELYEIRCSLMQDHGRDFLTVGSMGHCSSVALGIAMNTKAKVWCIDGDGAAVMHMGAMSVIGAQSPDNLVHIVINNTAHESVGGLPTSAGHTDLAAVAAACGYKETYRVKTMDELDNVLGKARGGRVLTFIEVMTAIGARKDLGRPVTSPEENKLLFMEHLKKLGDRSLNG